MTEGVIWRRLLEFSVPMVIGLLFQQLYNVVDTVVVGQFVGKEALAAVGSTGCIINMLVGLCSGLATGAGVVISQYFGAHNDQKLHDAVHTTILATIIISIVATGVGILIVKPMLCMMQTPTDVFDDATVYLNIYFAGMTGLLVYNMGSGILRAVGDSVRPLYFLIISALINIALDLGFVLIFGMGVDGVAYATIISQIISAIFVMTVLTRTKECYGVKWSQLCIKREELAKVLSIGLPSGIQQAVTSFSNVFVQSYINAFQSDCMAGWAAYGKLDAFIGLPINAIALASTTFVGQNYGAKNMERAKRGTRQSLLMALGVTAVLCALTMCFARPLLHLFTQEDGVIDFGQKFVLLISPFYLCICFNQIYAGALRGIGNTRVPVMIMLGSFVVFRQIYLYVDKLLGGHFVSVALAYPAGWVVCSILMTVCYLKSDLFRKQKQAGEQKINANSEYSGGKNE